jgi:hypothetical protein
MGVCTAHPKRKCCFCLAAVRGIKLLPVVDLVEFVIEVIILALWFTLQDTWGAHFSLMLIVTTVATIVKLVGCLAIFCSGVPGSAQGYVTTWPYKCYLWVRFLALLMFCWGWILNYALASWAIGDDSYYGDVSWGLCSFCFDFDQCESDYKEYKKEVKIEQAKDGRPMEPGSDPTYSKFFHRHITTA